MVMTAPATLLDLTVGETAIVGAITDADLLLVATRLGLAEGSQLQLKAKIPGGPMVFALGQTEIALGRELCHQIEAIRLE